MPTGDISLFSMLRTKMHWHQERQRVLAENVANADTPRFQARDLAPLRQDLAASGGSTLPLTRTAAGHASLGAAGNGFARTQAEQIEVRPTGNAVNLEDEMLKVANNQMDYQAATALYTRSLGLLKLALGKR